MVARVSVKSILPEELYLDQLPAETRQAFLRCISLPLFQSNQWYLAGGTGLALQVGHRQSFDLDFFTPRATFQNFSVERELLATGQWQTTLQEAGTLYGIFMKAKMSLIAYPFFIPGDKRVRCGTIRLLTPEDIAAMKIIAISQRGRKRDFVDLYWYCRHREDLTAVLYRAIKQYPGQEKNLTHLIKSLTYFNDAEQDLMPTIFFTVSWPSIKNFFKREAVKAAQHFLGA